MKDDFYLESINIPLIDTITDVDHKDRLEELDPFWLFLFPEEQIYRFIYQDQDLDKSENIETDSYRELKKEYNRPLLLIHGYSSSHTTWNWLVQLLWRQGYRNIFALELKNYNVGLDKLYSQLDNAITKVLATLSYYYHIHVIAHSLGGIIARYYIKNHEYAIKGRPNIGFCFTLASPHYGLLAPLRKFKKFESLVKRIIDPRTVDIFSHKSGLYESIHSKSQERDFYYITMINIQGSLKRYANTDGTFKPRPVNDMINFVIPVGHFRINKDEITADIITKFLQQRISIYKIRLVFIDFINKNLKTPFSLFFKIKPRDLDEQRYPIHKDIELTEENKDGLIPNHTLIIFNGYIDLNKHNHEEVLFSIYKKDSKSDKEKLLLKHKISFKTSDSKPLYDFHTLNHDDMNIYLSILSHTLIKEDYYQLSE